MNQNSKNLFDDIHHQLRPALPGMFFAVLTLLFGFALGVVFGLNEAAIKSRHKSAAAAVRDSVYHGDDVAIKAVLDKSWVYAQRAHLHAGGIGATAVGLILLVVLLCRSTFWKRLISLGLGLGGFGYSLFWLVASCRAPTLGGTTAAKESLKWLAMPSSGAIVLCTLAVLVLVVVKMVSRMPRHATK